MEIPTPLTTLFQYVLKVGAYLGECIRPFRIIRALIREVKVDSFTPPSILTYFIQVVSFVVILNVLS